MMISDRQKVDLFEIMLGTLSAIANHDEADPRRLASIALSEIRERLARDEEAKSHRHGD